jgi:hypothetical protein
VTKYIPHGRVHGKPAESAAECVTLINEMIEHAQEEANRTHFDTTRREMIAARNALTEAKRRIRDGEADPAWVVRSTKR